MSDLPKEMVEAAAVAAYMGVGALSNLRSMHPERVDAITVDIEDALEGAGMPQAMACVEALRIIVRNFKYGGRVYDKVDEAESLLAAFASLPWRQT